jgi:hypothetical protein
VIVTTFAIKTVGVGLVGSGMNRLLCSLPSSELVGLMGYLKKGRRYSFSLLNEGIIQCNE